MPKAGKFFEKWIDDNVTSIEKGGSSLVALTLADKCREAAAAIGITVDEMELKYGTLEKIIYEAMHHDVGTPSD